METLLSILSSDCGVIGIQQRIANICNSLYDQSSEVFFAATAANLAQHLDSKLSTLFRQLSLSNGFAHDVVHLPTTHFIRVVKGVGDME